MLNKLLQYFNLKLVKLEPKSFLKDIEFDADGKNPYDPLEEETKKEVKEPIKEIKITELKIHFKQGHFLSWTSEIELDKKDFAWSDFYTWYFSRLTPYFVFKHKEGETIFLRADIIRIEYFKPVLKEIKKT